MDCSIILICEAIEMELRMLEYFLVVAREQNITAAAESLHISQPVLSTQLKAMETELGKQLLIRGVKGSRKVLLTEEGMILRKQAEEILSLVRRTEEEITGPGETIPGNVYIGTGETEVMRLLAHAATNVQRQHPDIRYNILSGNAEYVFECLDKGLIDFGLVFKKVDLQKYEAFPMPVKDTWGGTDAKRFAAGGEGVYLFGRPVGQAAHRLPSKGRRPLPRTLAAKKEEDLHIVATYNLVFNASLLVGEGLGYALCYVKLINTQGTNLCFRPFSPPLDVYGYIIWKKYQVFSRAASAFLQALRALLQV